MRQYPEQLFLADEARLLAASFRDTPASLALPRVLLIMTLSNKKGGPGVAFFESSKG
jgi:hypothetical protein